MSKLAVAAGPKPVRVRAFVYCSTDTFATLAQIGSNWLYCMAAHQSNIVNAAEAAASSSQRRPPADYLKHRTNWEVANKVDADRLRRLIEVWPDLTRRQQEELVDEFNTVCHGK